jgi:hypothetical protein
MVNQRSYGCGGHREGACEVKTLVRRDHVENAILDPIRKELLSPQRIAAWHLAVAIHVDDLDSAKVHPRVELSK